MSPLREIARSSFLISILTITSRIFGMIRDMLRAEYFGVSPLARAFVIAMKIPNTLRNLVGEGALTQSFIPIFAEYLHKNGENKKNAFQMASTIISIVLVLMIIIVIIGEFFSPYIVRLFYFQWEMTETMELTTTLTRTMFPYILFLSVASLFMGILNTFKHFTAPALSSVLLNVSVIVVYIFVFPFFQSKETQVKLLALGVVIGGIFQLALQIYKARAFGFRFRFKLNFSHPAVKSIFTIMIPAIFGSGVYQINQLIDVVLASYVEKDVPGAVASLEYAVKLMQFPLGAFGLAISTSVMPRLALLLVKKEHNTYKDTLANGYALIAFITFPAMVGLVMLAEPIISLILERGAFDAYATGITTLPLVFYAIGIFFYSCVKITVAAFYSMKDSKTPVKVAAVILVLNLVLSVILMQYIYHAGIALAASIGSFFHISILFFVLRKKLGGGMHISKIISQLLKTILSTIVMALVVAYLYYLEHAWLLVFNKFKVLVIITIASASYFFTAWLLKVESMNEILALLKRKK